MTSDIRQKALELANRSYRFQVTRDETTDGHPAYLAQVVELEGCVGQGQTVEEALTDVKAAMVDYIESLLADGLPIPSPLEELPISRSSSYRPVQFTYRAPAEAGTHTVSGQVRETEHPAYILTVPDTV